MNLNSWLKWKFGASKFNSDGYCYFLNVNGTKSYFKNIKEAVKTFNKECDRLRVQCGMITREQADLNARMNPKRDEIVTPNSNLYYKEYDFVDSISGKSAGFVELGTLRKE